MLTVIARYLVQDGRESTVENLLDRNATATQAEPGCLEFSVYRRTDDPRRFLLYERYTDEEAFQQHRHSAHFADIIERQVVPLLAERVWSRVEPC
jgi:quinol monooxygenase YgiN